MIFTVYLIFANGKSFNQDIELYIVCQAWLASIFWGTINIQSSNCYFSIKCNVLIAVIGTLNKQILISIVYLFKGKTQRKPKVYLTSKYRKQYRSEIWVKTGHFLKSPVIWIPGRYLKNPVWRGKFSGVTLRIRVSWQLCFTIFQIWTYEWKNLWATDHT